ncbi:MAG TPA: DUF4476 domain-containing protein [Flavisolibacter sp.]|nr:DUF4476 domain-containing protein [Flavisolibacter sp.]
MAAFFAASAYSQSLRVSFSGNRDFQLMVDGKTYNSTSYSDNDVVLNNLSGKHDVSVYKINKRGRSKKLYSSAVSLSYGQEVHLTINNDGSISREETSSNAAYGYKSPMSSTDFNQVYRNVNTQWSQASKMSEARDVFNNSSYYFSADQTRQIVGLISSEANRLELLKLAYDNITDQSNFYQLYDLLRSQASRDELDNYVRSYSYGDSYNSYKVAMNDYNFNQLYQNVVNQRNTSKKLSEATRILNTSTDYFNVSQIVQLISLVTGENNRLQLAKLSLDNIVDAQNMTQLFNLLSTQPAKENLDYYIRNNGYSGTDYNYHVAMSDATFTSLYENIRKKWLPFTKYNAAVDAFSSSDNFFTTQQVHQIIALLSDESNRLNLAKLAFDNIVDQQNFRQLYDLFDSQSSKDELDNYIKTNYNYQY